MTARARALDNTSETDIIETNLGQVLTIKMYWCVF